MADGDILQAFRAALALHQSGQVEAALQAYRALLEQAPRHPEALNNLAALEIGA